MMKLILFTLLGLSLSLSPLRAQEAESSPTTSQSTDYNSPEYKAALATNALIKTLGLTGEQREKVYCAKLTFLQKKAALIRKHEREGGSSMAARLELYEYRKQSEREIREALTSEQARRFDAYQEELQAAPQRRY
jgi:hypothetical protein